MYAGNPSELMQQLSVSACRWGIPVSTLQSTTYRGITPACLMALLNGSVVVVAPPKTLRHPPVWSISLERGSVPQVWSVHRGGGYLADSSTNPPSYS